MSEHVCVNPAICGICSDDSRIVPLRDKFAAKIMDWVARQIVVSDDTVIVGYGSLADDLVSLVEEERRACSLQQEEQAERFAELKATLDSVLQRARLAERKLSGDPEDAPEKEPVIRLGSYTAVQYQGPESIPAIKEFVGERLLGMQPLTEDGDLLGIIVRNASVVREELIDETLCVGESQWLVCCPMRDGNQLYSVMGDTPFQVLQQNCDKETG